MEKTSNNKKIPPSDKITEIVSSAFRGRIPTDISANEYFFAQSYANILINALSRQKITPQFLSICARLFLMFEKEPMSAVVLIGNNMKIKDIFPLTRRYTALFSEMSSLLIHRCKLTKTRRCAVIYNYPYKRDFVKRLCEADELFALCRENKILLADIIEFSGGNAESLMLPICWNGTDLINI